MKFHHLAKHNQFVASLNQQRDLSPIKQQLQQASNQLQRQAQHLADLSDEEEDEYNGGQDFYDSTLHQQPNSRMQIASNNHHHSQQVASSNQPIDSNGFLMDKNKKLFPQKLWELIHNPSIQHCLRWSQDGQRVYLNRNEFEAYYLKTPNNQFHTQKAISFVRQMNMYGFRKVDDCYYENDNFRRDRQHLLRNMIRRHPNKGLFVGLDHHQLAAAAAAQQAIQVNQQLQHLENQHKHRAEQALRLNSYLNSHHQFASGLAHPNQPKHSHSSPFDHMSSQLAQAAANHLNQQQHQHQHQQQQLNHLSHSNNLTAATNRLVDGGSIVDKTGAHLGNGLQAPTHHQPKKSRLLSNFYASNASSNNGMQNGNDAFADVNQADQLMYNQDSMHSTSSVDTQPSQCSSVVNSGSAGSPQPSSPSVLHQRLASLATNQRQHQPTSTSSSITAAALAAGKETSGSLQGIMNRFAANGELQLNGATDLSSQSLATRQALHQTLVRSLLQLKNQQPHDFIASLQQQQNSRSLLESLASLGSVGSGSMVDPTSNSPTERTATPPSCPPSPGIVGLQYETESDVVALDLARKSSPKYIRSKRSSISCDNQNEGVDFALGTEAESEAEDADSDSIDVGVGRSSAGGSPLDSTKKVRRFLDNQMTPDDDNEAVAAPTQIKRERESQEEMDSSCREKKLKLDDNSAALLTDAKTVSVDDEDEMSVSSISRSLIIEMCSRRGDRINMEALEEAARYTECFLDILLYDAALISRHSTSEESVDKIEASEESETPKDDDEDAEKSRQDNEIGASSLSLALKLIPTKLLATIQQQQQQEQQ